MRNSDRLFDRTDPAQTAADGFPLDEEDVHGAKGSGPVGEDEDGNPGHFVAGDSNSDRDPESELEFENAVGGVISAAEDWVDQSLSFDREKLNSAYMADPMGNEEEGRSQVVMPEVRGAVMGHMPGLIRFFCGTARYASFECGKGTPQEQADFQYDIVNYVLMSDNDGYTHIHSMLMDGCRKRMGAFEWWWDESETVQRIPFTDISENSFALLQSEATDRSTEDELISYEIEVENQVEDGTQQDGNPVPSGMQTATSPELDFLSQLAPNLVPKKTYRYSGYLSRRVIRKRARFEAVPPEEVIFVPTTSANLDDYPMVGRRQSKTISELVAMGFDEERIDALLDESTASGASTLEWNRERLDRADKVKFDRILNGTDALEAFDESSKSIKFCRIYINVDYDGDGIAERRKICTIGDNHKIIYNEVWENDEVPMAIGTPYPEPHAPFGLSVADLAMDTQEVKTELVRQTLDSLAEAVLSRVAFVQGKVNIDDVLNTRRGAAIRTTDSPSNVMQNVSLPFVGAQAMPLIQYIDEDRNKKTGTNPATPTGFDPDSTQSTAREAIGSMIDAAQERTEYIARNFGETAFKRLLRGIRNMLLRHQDHRRTIRMNGEDVEFDPRSWTADMDVEIQIGSGRSSSTKRLQHLQTIQAMQVQIVTQFGLSNGYVTPIQLSNVNNDMMREMGFKNTSRYFNKIDKAAEDKILQQAAAAGQKPSPEDRMANAADAKNKNDLFLGVAKVRAELIRADKDTDQKRDAAEMKFHADMVKILGQFGLDVDESQMRQAIEMNNMATGIEQALAPPIDQSPGAAPQPSGVM